MTPGPLKAKLRLLLHEGKSAEVNVMDRRVLIGVTMTFAFAVLPATAFSQAVTEYGMTTGSAATSAVKGGSAINRGSMQLAGRLAESIGKTTQNVNVMEENKQKLELKSRAGGGTVHIDSVPDKAAISIDGAEVAYTPANLKIPQGKHTIELKHPTSLPWRKEVSLSRDESLSLKAELEKKYKSVINLSFPK